MFCEKLSDVVGRIAAANTAGELTDLLADIAAEFGFCNAAYYRLSRFGEPLSPTPIFGKSFDAWLKVYAERNYALTDPVIPWIYRRDLPFSSREVAEKVPEPAELHADRHSLWAYDGLFCPVATSWGEVGVVCWGRETRIELADRDRLAMGNLSRAFVTRFKFLAQEEVLPGLPIRPLARREVECAYWLSQGKQASGVAQQLKLSVHTVRQYIDTACTKLRARNRGEMVLRASALGLIPNLEQDRPAS